LSIRPRRSSVRSNLSARPAKAVKAQYVSFLTDMRGLHFPKSAMPSLALFCLAAQAHILFLPFGNCPRPYCSLYAAACLLANPKHRCCDLASPATAPLPPPRPRPPDVRVLITAAAYAPHARPRLVATLWASPLLTGCATIVGGRCTASPSIPATSATTRPSPLCPALVS
jgi:hypothetical protein